MPDVTFPMAPPRARRWPMLRLTVLGAALTIGLAACQQQAPAPATSPAPDAAAVSAAADARFTELAARWLDGWLQLQPVSATQIGDHRFDDRVDDLSAEGRQRALDFHRKMVAELDGLDARQLSRANQIDAAMLRNQVRYDLWSTETLQGWAWDPQLYSQLAGGALYTLMAREFAPLPQRLNSAAARMERIPVLFTQMRENLDPTRVPRIHAETVARQHAGILSIVDGLIAPQAGQLPDAERKRLEAAIKTLRAAVAEQQEWLDKTLVPNAKGDFRIGETLYDEKLAFALSSPLSRKEIRTRAEAEITRTRAEMYDIARKVLAMQTESSEPTDPAMPITTNTHNEIGSRSHSLICHACAEAIV